VNLEIAAPLKARLQHVEIIVIVLDIKHFGGHRFLSCLTASQVTFGARFIRSLPREAHREH
jgi:hypothetical protein